MSILQVEHRVQVFAFMASCDCFMGALNSRNDFNSSSTFWLIVHLYAFIMKIPVVSQRGPRSGPEIPSVPEKTR